MQPRRRRNRKRYCRGCHTQTRQARTGNAQLRSEKSEFDRHVAFTTQIFHACSRVVVEIVSDIVEDAIRKRAKLVQGMRNSDRRNPSLTAMSRLQRRYSMHAAASSSKS